MPLLFLRGITQIYTQGNHQVKALDNLDLDIYEGEFVVIMGPSGSGKSTLLNIISGLDAPQTGEFRYKNFAIPGSSSDILALYRQRIVGIVFQKYNLLQKVSARFNISLPRLLAFGQANEKVVDTLTDVLNLNSTEKVAKSVERLSQGQQQRVAIARALINDPEIIIADEPTGNLDSKNSEIIGELFYRINKEKRKTVVFVTHNPMFQKYADRVIHLKDGKIDHIDVIHDKKYLPEYSDNILVKEKPAAAAFSLLTRIASKLLFSEKRKLFSAICGVSIGIAIVMMTASYIYDYYKFVIELPLIRPVNEIQVTSLNQVYYFTPMANFAPSDSVSMGRKITQRGLQLLSHIPDVTAVYPVIPMDAAVNQGSSTFHVYVENTVPLTQHDPHVNPLETGSYFTSDTEDSIIISKFLGDRLLTTPLQSYASLIGTYLPVDITIREYAPSRTIHIHKNLLIRGVFSIKSEDNFSVVPYDFDHLISTNTMPFYTTAVVYADQEANIPQILRSIRIDGFDLYTFSQFSGLQSIYLYLESGPFILTAAFGIFALILGFLNLLSFTSRQKIKDIASLFAVGMRNSDIRNYILSEACVFGVTAGILGCIITFAAIAAITYLTDATFYMNITLPNEELFYVTGYFIPAILAISILISLIESIFIAARLSSHKELVDALRRE